MTVSKVRKHLLKQIGLKSVMPSQGHAGGMNTTAISCPVKFHRHVLFRIVFLLLIKCTKYTVKMYILLMTMSVARPFSIL